MLMGCVWKPGGFAAICVLVAALGASSDGVAQDLTSLEVDSTGKCDEAKLKAAGFKRRLGYTFVLKHGRILTVNSASAADTVEADVKVFDRADLIAEDPKSGKLFVEIGDDPNKLCGWIAPVKPKRDADGFSKPLLMRDTQLKKQSNSDEFSGLAAFTFGPKPMMVSEGPEARKNEGNPLGLKAVISNLGVSGPANVPVYGSPDAPEPIHKLKFFDIFEIYDWVELPAAKAPTPDRAGNYYLIGTNRTDSANRTDTLELHGWIRDTDVYLWNTRMAIYWRTETSGAYASGLPQMKVYKEADHLDAKGPHVLTGPEPGQQNVDEPGGIHRRYPVLEISPDEQSIEAEIAKKNLDRDADRDKIERLIKYIKISAPGEACDEARKDCISSYDVDTLRQGAARAEEKAHNIDILFVVDGTESMEPYLKPIAGALGRFISNFDKQKAGRSVHFGLYTYGDYIGSGTDKIDGKLDIGFAEAGPRQVEEFQNFAQSYAAAGLPYGDLHGDLPEASF